MILLYDGDGNIKRVQVGQCLNVASVATDGYMVCDVGGKRELPAGLLPFNLDELSLPVEADLVAAAVYGETGRYLIMTVDEAPALVEVVG